MVVRSITSIQDADDVALPLATNGLLYWDGSKLHTSPRFSVDVAHGTVISFTNANRSFQGYGDVGSSAELWLEGYGDAGQYANIVLKNRANNNLYYFNYGTDDKFRFIGNVNGQGYIFLEFNQSTGRVLFPQGIQSSYLSSDGSAGLTGSTGGLTFKNGLYVGGSLAPGGITRVQDASDVATLVNNGLLLFDGTKVVSGSGVSYSGNTLSVGTYIAPADPFPTNLSLDVQGSGRFRGVYGEGETTPGVYIGYDDGPRIGFNNGNAAQTWQIDSSVKRFRWFTPGIEQMVLTPWVDGNNVGSLDLCHPRPILNVKYIEFTDHVKAANYLSADGSTGATNTTGGMTFKSGLYIGGSATGGTGGGGGITRVQDASDVTTPLQTGGLVFFDGTNLKNVNALTTDGSNLYLKGGIGINNTNPSAPLDVVATDATLKLQATGSTSYSGINMVDENGTLAASFQYGNAGNNALANVFFIGARKAGGVITFITGGGLDERMRIAANGNVGIGTSNPSQLLHVNGNAYVQGSLAVVGAIYAPGFVQATDYHSNDGSVGVTTSGGIVFKNGLYMSGFTNALPLTGQTLSYDSAYSAYKPVYPAAYRGASLVVAGSGNGLSGSFSTINCDGGTQLYDPGNNYSTASGIYTVPITGLYQIDANIRLNDFTGATSYGHGVHSSNQDGPWFSWYQTNTNSTGQRNGAPYRRVAFFNQGDQLRHYGYCDQAVSVGDRSMSIVLLEAS